MNCILVALNLFEFLPPKFNLIAQSVCKSKSSIIDEVRRESPREKNFLLFLETIINQILTLHKLCRVSELDQKCSNETHETRMPPCGLFSYLSFLTCQELSILNSTIMNYAVSVFPLIFPVANGHQTQLLQHYWLYSLSRSLLACHYPKDFIRTISFITFCFY